MTKIFLIQKNLFWSIGNRINVNKPDNKEYHIYQLSQKLVFANWISLGLLVLGIIPSQAGWNKGESQKLMTNFGTPRNTSTKIKAENLAVSLSSFPWTTLNYISFQVITFLWTLIKAEETFSF